MKIILIQYSINKTRDKAITIVFIRLILLEMNGTPDLTIKICQRK